MKQAQPDNWHAANQRYLVAAIGCVRAAIERHSARRAGTPIAGDDAQAVLQAAAAALPEPAAIDLICEIFGLSPFERDLLLLCAAVELDGAVGSLCATAQGEPRRPFPTFGLALAALPGAHWSALTPDAPLRRWGLIDVEAGESLALGHLRIDERILHELAGVPYLDERLRAFVAPLGCEDQLPASQAAIASRIAALWRQAGEARIWPAAQLCGWDAAAARAIAATACAALGLQLYCARAADMPIGVADRALFGRLWMREAVLRGAALLIECEETGLDGERMRALQGLVESLPAPLLIFGREPLSLGGRAALRLDLPAPSPAEQHQLWEQGLGSLAERLNGQIATTVAQFSLGPDAIRSASHALRADQDIMAGDADAFAQRLWDESRATARQRLDDLAQRIAPAAEWNDLVLPEPQRATLREIAAHVRRRALVYDEWGFAAKGSRGLGISALFAGASGTGKTMAAEVLANELRLDLYRIDLSAVVSKYIGETEKNLRRVFDAAEAGGAILLFDEADALFGKRSEVKDSHDRYANVEISYLLQRMESYRGLAILTTNMKQALDQAFLRRIRFVVQFPFPDAAQRAAIWQRIFPAATPTEDLDANRLARLNIAGGNIRSIALNAAFLAADERAPVRMDHLLRAARSEYAKLEKPLSEAEVRGWT